VVINEGYCIIGTGFQQRIFQDTPQIEWPFASMVKIIVKWDVKKCCLGTVMRGGNRYGAKNTYLPLKRMNPRKDSCYSTYTRVTPCLSRTLIHTDFGDQYSATMNACDLPSRLRTCLIFAVGHRECIRERNYGLIGLLTHCKRNWRSICLMASRRKPVLPVV
jgi:hypothetical protein